MDGTILPQDEDLVRGFMIIVTNLRDPQGINNSLSS
jgi:hypothetical protein